MSLDDLYNHLKVYEAEVQKKSNLNSQNMAFISSSKHSSGDEDGKTTYASTSSTTFPTASASVAIISQDTTNAYIASQSSGSQIKFKDINQINEDDMEEIDIKWSMALLSMRADKFWKRTGKKICIQGSDVAGFDKSKVECFNLIPQVTYQSPQAPKQLMTESPFIDSGFAVPVFSPRDDLIACLNKAMVFLTAIASSRFPSTNKQLRTSSNARNQATVQEGKKAMLVEAQEARKILDKEQLTFLADPGIPAGQAQTIIPHNAAFQTEDLDTYDSDCDDLSNSQTVLMANISNYGSDVILEVPNSETYLNDMDNQSVHAL
nr:hypothetical protein [Tanacetum cinerariifolium]